MEADRVLGEVDNRAEPIAAQLSIAQREPAQVTVVEEQLDTIDG